MNLASLTVALGLNSAKYREGLQKSAKRGADFAATTTKHLKRVTLAFAGMSTAGVAALTLIYKRQSQAIDQTAKFAARIGVSTTALTGLHHAAALTGVEVGTMNTALQRMSRRVEEAAAGTGEAKKALAELGLDAEKLVNLAPDQQFKAIADAMERVGDKTRFAAKIFDSEGVALINTMRGGSKAIQAMQTDAEQLGLTFTNSMAARVEAANDAIYRSTSLFTAMSNHFTIALSPAVEGVANWLTELTREAIAAKGGMQAFGFSIASSVIDGVGIAAQALEDLMNATAIKTQEQAAAIWSDEYRAIEQHIEAEKERLNDLYFALQEQYESLVEKGYDTEGAVLKDMDAQLEHFNQQLLELEGGTSKFHEQLREMSGSGKEYDFAAGIIESAERAKEAIEATYKAADNASGSSKGGEGSSTKDRQERQESLEGWQSYWQMRESLSSYHANSIIAINSAIAHREQEQLKRTQENINNLASAFSTLQQSMYFGGEENNLTRLLGIAQQTVVLYNAMAAAKALSSGSHWTEQLLAYTQIIAAGAAIGSSIAGMSHDGSSGFPGGRIPREGTWLLDGGEKVQTRSEADRHERALSMIEQGQMGQAVNVTPTMIVQGGDQRTQQQMLDAFTAQFINDVRTGGKMSQAIKTVK